MISQAGFLALLQSQGGGPPPPPPEPTDEQAAAIGASIQSQNSKLFSALDSDGSGVLSASELKAGMDALRGGSSSSGSSSSSSDAAAATFGAQLQQDDPSLFASLDSDGDGTLSADELTAGLTSHHGGHGPPAMSDEDAAAIGTTMQQDDPELFASLDADGNGTLSADELKAGMDQLHDATAQQGPPPPPPPPSSDSTSSGDSDVLASLLAQLQSSSSSSGLSDYRQNQMSEILRSLFATSGT
jgi:Ca2+-binding EF-hand superfamily protein